MDIILILANVINNPLIVLVATVCVSVSNKFVLEQLRRPNHFADIRSSSSDSMNDNILEFKSAVYNQSFFYWYLIETMTKFNAHSH